MYMKLFSRKNWHRYTRHPFRENLCWELTSIVKKIERELRTYHAQPEKGKENKVAIVYLSLLPSDIYIQLHI